MSRRSIHLFFFRASELWQLEEGKEHTFLTQIESANKVVNLLNHQCSHLCLLNSSLFFKNKEWMELGERVELERRETVYEYKKHLPKLHPLVLHWTIESRPELEHGCHILSEIKLRRERSFRSFRICFSLSTDQREKSEWSLDKEHERCNQREDKTSPSEKLVCLSSERSDSSRSG